MNKITKILLCLAAALSLSFSSFACTNIIVTKGASKDGSVIVAYACDHWSIYGTLDIGLSQYYPAGEMIQYADRNGNIYAEFPQVPRTFNRVGHVNEYGVMFTETTFDGREELYDPDGLFHYYDLIYLALERAKTAREAIQIVADLVDEYGYNATGESFSIGDKNEVWIMELISKGSKIVDGVNVRKGGVWAAVRIPDGYVSAHANQSRISKIDFNDPENFMYAKDVVDFAREAGYFKGKDEDFSFCDAYDPIDFGGMRHCDARVWSAFNIMGKGMIGDRRAEEYEDYAMGRNPKNRLPLYIKPAEKLGILDVAHIMRNHYEGTVLDMTQDIGAGGHQSPFRCSPMVYEYKGERYTNERPIATPQTGFWVICQTRPWMPDELSGICWFGVDDSGTSCPIPCYASMTRAPKCISEESGNSGEYSDESLFWITNRVANFAYGLYDRVAPDIHKTADHYINCALAEIPAVDSVALAMLNNKDRDMKAEAIEYITEYSYKKAEQRFKTWQNLDKYSLAKYRDGDVKVQNDPDEIVTDELIPKMHGAKSPGYSEKWKEAVVKDAGKKFKVAK